MVAPALARDVLLAIVDDHAIEAHPGYPDCQGLVLMRDASRFSDAAHRL